MMIDLVDNNKIHLCTVDALELSVRLEHLSIDHMPDQQIVVVAGRRTHLLACCKASSFGS